MDKYANKIIMAIVLLLAFDLWGVHAKLLYQLNPDKVGNIASTFSYVAMNENTITAMLFALVFAFVPVLVLTTISPKLEQYWLFVLLFALFDGGAWFIYYNKTAIAHFETYGAGYYGLFVVFIVASVGFIRMRLEELEEKQPDKQMQFRTQEQQQKLRNDAQSNLPNNHHVDTSFVNEEFISDTFRKMEEKKVFHVSKPAIINNSNDDKIITDEDKIVMLLNDNWAQKDIADSLKWHPSKVSRTIKKLKENGRIET